MSTVKKITQAIDAAIRSLPPELIRITADYLTERPHSWTAFETVQVIPTADGGTDIVDGDRNRAYPWRRLVSATTFSDGYLRWFADFDVRSMYRWIGVGVTLSSDNRCFGPECNDVGHIAQDDDWILYPSYQYNTMYVGHNRLLRTVCSSICDRTYSCVQFRIQFDADPTAGLVVAQVRCKVDDDGDFDQPRSITIFDAAAVANSSAVIDVRRLRPCVVSAGCGSVVIRSNSKGKPDTE